MSFYQAIEEFIFNILQIRHYSKATASSYRRVLRKFSGFLASHGISDITKISLDTLHDFIAEVQVFQPLAIATIRQYCHALMSFFKFCVLRKYIPLSPAIGLSVPKKPMKMPVIFSEDEYQKFIDTEIHTRKDVWLGKMETVIIRAFSCLGLRFSEVQSIRLTDINMSDKKIVINGKGSYQRVLYIPDKLLISLNEYLQNRPNIKNNYLFISRDCRSRVGRSALYDIFKRHIKRCRIEQNKYTPHACRHAFAIRVYRQTKNIILVSKLLGHKSLETTQIYLNFIMVDDMRDGLNSAF